MSLQQDLAELESAEDFLEYFNIPFESQVVQVNRLHILQRFHDYLAAANAEGSADKLLWGLYAGCLGRAYRDFVASDARTERVLKVYRRDEPQSTFVPIDQAFT